MLRDVLRTSGVQLVQLTCGLAALVLTARLLGPEGRGTLGALMAWVGLFSAAGSLSLESVVLHRAARSGTKDWYPPLFAALRRMYLVLVLATMLAALACWWLAGDRLFGALPPGLLLAAWLLLPIMIWARYQGALLLALGSLERRNQGVMLSNLAVVVALLVALWLFDLGIAGALAAQALSALLLVLWGLRWLLRAAQGGRARHPWRAAGRLALDGGKVHAAQVGHYVYGSVDVVTLNAVAGPAAVGWYQLALRLIDVGGALPQAVATVFRARMGGRSPRGAWRSQRRPVLLTVIATLLAGGIGWLLAPWAIPLIAGEEFQPTVPLFRLLLPVLLARTLEQLLVPQIFARGYFLTGSLLSLAQAGISAVLFLWLVPRDGLDGAVTAALLVFALLPTVIYLGWIWWFERDLRRAPALSPDAAP